MQRFGEGVARVTRLLHVQGHVDGLHRVPPLAVHLAARQLLLQTILLDSEQERREGENCKWESRGKGQKQREEPSVFQRCVHIKSRLIDQRKLIFKAPN